MKTVSVIVATYRRATDLKTALDSLAGQTYSAMEIILVDDNADVKWNQTVAKIARDFQERNPNIPFRYLVNERNFGSAETRNIGIEAATGFYITFLDDDDVYLPDKLRNQVDFMEKGGYDYTITDLDLYHENGKLIDKRRRTYIKDTSQKALEIYHLKYHITGTDVIMMTADYLKKIGGFLPIDVGDEYYLMQRAIEENGKFGYLPVCDVKAYVHTGEGGLSSGDRKIEGENMLYQYKKKSFPHLDAKTKRYIRMRHYAVLAFAEWRRRRIVSFFVNAVKSFFCAPIACVGFLWER